MYFYVSKCGHSHVNYKYMSEIMKINKCEIIFSLFIWWLIIGIWEMHEFLSIEFYLYK